MWQDKVCYKEYSRKDLEWKSWVELSKKVYDARLLHVLHIVREINKRCKCLMVFLQMVCC
jgi:hypothetical protein